MAGKMWISVLGSAALLAVGLTGWMVTQSNGQAPAPEAASVVVDLPPLTQEALRQTLEARLKTVQARMSGATEGTLAALLQEQDALARAVANPALTLQKTEANRRLLVETLSDFGAHPSGEAAVALGAGDLVGAAPLFAGIRAQAEADLRRAAKAAFALGQIQLAQGNGVGAAGYLLRAADLDARAPYLREAERVALQAGNTAAALNLGPRLLSVTLAEYGENSTEHAEALSQIGQTLLVAGRVKDAEAVFRDAVAVGAKGPDPASEGQAQRLNNLAALLRATGNAAEAEPLFRQAIDIDRAAPNGAYADAPDRKSVV